MSRVRASSVDFSEYLARQARVNAIVAENSRIEAEERAANIA